MLNRPIQSGLMTGILVRWELLKLHQLQKKVAGHKEDEVIIIGIGHTSPGHPVILAKHSAKEERAAMEKGKWSNDLSSYAHLSAQELTPVF